MGTLATFSGSSKYAADLQQAINHAVAIAAIPLRQLNSNVSLLNSQSAELDTLQTKFSAIQTAIQSLSSATAGKGLSASVEDDSVASATLDASVAVSGGTYDLKVIDPGAPTTTLSKDTLPVVSDPFTTSISTSNTFDLTVAGAHFSVTPSSNSLSALAQAINSSGAPVNATLVNIGAPSAPNYRLSLQSTKLGDIAMQLNDGSSDLLSNLTTGAEAQYQIDGLPAIPISSSTDTVTIAPGLTVNLRQAGETTITVAPNPSSATDAISSFVAAYNAASLELNQNHGTGGGALTGQSIVFTLQQALRTVSSYSGGSSAVQGLADLGLSFDDHGQLSFNQAQFQTVSAAHPNDISAFLGSATGGGFLKSALDILNGLGNSADGTFTQALNSAQSQINRDNAAIDQTDNRILQIQNQITAQMSRADTLIASLEAKLSYFTDLFQATQNVLKG